MVDLEPQTLLKSELCSLEVKILDETVTTSSLAYSSSLILNCSALKVFSVTMLISVPSQYCISFPPSTSWNRTHDLGTLTKPYSFEPMICVSSFFASETAELVLLVYWLLEELTTADELSSVAVCDLLEHEAKKALTVTTVPKINNFFILPPFHLHYKKNKDFCQILT